MPGVIPCPDTEVLRQFLLGRLVPDAVEHFADHLESCLRCVDALAELKENDALLAALRLASTAVVDAPAHVIERACALCVASPSTNPEAGLLVRLAAQQAEPTLELYDFLRPQQPGELGRLGRYRLLHVVGAGGMGVVFAAEDTDLKRRVALKVLRPALAASAAARHRFLREGQAAAALSHEGIVPIYEVGEDHGVPYLTMPLLQGETLEQRLRREPILPAADVLHIGRAVALALSAAHAQGLIHRDIKPGNIFLADAVPGVMLLDFGLARAVGGDEHLTQSGVVIGTPAYMAPEQARGEKVDHRSDLFGLGCVLYRACTGQVPFPGSNALATLLALAQGNPPTPSRLNPLLPPGLSELVLKLLAPSADERYQTAEDTTAALDAVAAGRVKPPRRRQRWAAGITGLLALLAGLVFAFAPGTPSPQLDQTTSPPPFDWFEEARQYACGLYPRSVALGDFNGDGKTDLVVGNHQSHSVGVMLGNGDGTFRPPLTALAGEWFATSVTTADLDADGKRDLVVAAGNNRISVLLGKGDGTFHPLVSYPVGTNPSHVAVADLNADGRLDLAVSNGDGQASILLGKGDGSFRAAVNSAAGTECRAVVVGDFDRDGQLDLALADYTGDRVCVLRGNGDGSFRSPVHFAANHAPTFLTTADLDGDGRLDLVVGHNGNGLLVLKGGGDGTFRAVGRYDATAGPCVLVVADLDHDGRLDLAYPAEEDNAVRVWHGVGDGSFDRPAAYKAGKGTYALTVGDVNRDGLVDLIAANVASNDVSVLLHRPAPPTETLLGPAVHYPSGAEPRATAVGDLDRDGKDDLVVADQGANAVRVLLGNGDGSFRSGGSFAVGTGPVAVALGDLDRDGRLDLAAVNAHGNSVSVLRATSDGFTEAVHYAVGKNPSAATLGDFNRDGRLDLVVANYDDATLSVLVGKGDGTFQEARSFAAGKQPRQVSVADFNGDGRLDLAVANRVHLGTVSVLLGRGDGTFGTPVSHAVGSFPLVAAAADFNGDGKPDLAVGNWGSSDVNVLLGKGDGGFATPVNYPAMGNRLLSLAAVDLDGDGRLDLVASCIAQYLSVLKGNGDGTFARGVYHHGTGHYPEGLAVGRFKGDGRWDVVTANARSGSVSVLLNRPAAPFLQVEFSHDRLEPDSMSGTLTVTARSTNLGQDSRDRGYRGTLRLHGSDPRSDVPSSLTLGADDEGRRALRVTFRTAGSQTVTVSDDSGARLPGSVSLWVTRAADLRLRLETPAQVGAGKPFTASVHILNSFGEWIDGYRGTLKFHCTDATATLPKPGPFKDGGVLHTFTNEVVMPRAGRWTLSVADSTNPGLKASAEIAVGPASPGDNP